MNKSINKMHLIIFFECCVLSIITKFTAINLAMLGFKTSLSIAIMWGGIFAGSAQILGGASKLLANRNVNFSDKFNWLYGNRNSQSTTLLRVNKTGKQLFRIDADIIHLWHLHYGTTNSLMRIHRTGIMLFSYLGTANFLKGLFGGFGVK